MIHIGWAVGFAALSAVLMAMAAYLAWRERDAERRATVFQMQAISADREADEAAKFAEDMLAAVNVYRQEKGENPLPVPPQYRNRIPKPSQN